MADLAHSHVVAAQRLMAGVELEPVYNLGSGGTTGCPQLAAGSTNAQAGGSETSKYVEVRVCYRFSAFFEMTIPFIGGSLSPLSGNFFLERIRTFTVADY